MADLRISALPQTASRAQPVADTAPARRHDYGFTAESTGSELDGLVRGLSILNPALERYNQGQIEQAANAAHRAGIDAANNTDMSGMAADQMGSNPLPSTVPPAFDNAYREGLMGILGDRAGAQVKAAMLTEYNQKKDVEGFDLGGFFSDFRKRNMAGFTDTRMGAPVGQGINSMEVAIRGDVEKARMQRQLEAVDAAFSQVVQDRVSPTMNPDELWDSYQTQILPQARSINKSPKDAAAAFLSRVMEMSDSVKGDPKMFEVFEKMDDEGMTLANRNPELIQRITGAKAQAKAQQDNEMLKAGQVNMMRGSIEMDKLRDSNPSAITPDFLAEHIGQFKRFTTDEQAVAYYAQAQSVLAKQAGVQSLQSHWDGNTMNRLDPSVQKDLIEANLGPQMDVLFEAAKKGDVTQVATLGESIAKTAALKRVTMAVPAIERFVDVLNTMPMRKEGPDNAFKVQAELYKSLSANPAFRDLHYKDNAADIMRTYTRMVEAGSDPLAAYTSAYAGTTPEAKKAAEVAAKDPAFAKAAHAAVDQVIGSSFWPQWLGGNGRPGNADVVEADASAAMMDFKRTHPNASMDDLKGFAKGYVSQNWIHDTTTGGVLKVPKAFAGEQTQEAVSDFSKRLLEAYRLKDLSGDYKVEYVPEGTNGDVQVYLTNGMGSRTPIGRQNLETITQAHRLEGTIDHSPGGEGDRLGMIRKQVESGTVDPAFIQENFQLISKARALKALPKDVFKKLDKLNSETMLKRLKEVPAMSFGKPDYSSMMTPTTRNGTKVDPKVTAQVALRFATSPVGAGASTHGSMAASLITMGEAVMLQSYPDPAKDAGNNIGTGYNLKANAANAASDLKRSGVPESLVQDVIDGKRQMTTDQVMRLTQIAMPRYETLARETAEKSAPGLWEKMTPPQRAVMIDVAYQVGNVAQFKQAWAALAKGDAAAFAEHAQTSFVNKAGVRVKDTRRNSLRAAMLQGNATWVASIQKYGSLPSNAIDVAVLNQK